MDNITLTKVASAYKDNYQNITYLLSIKIF